MELSVLSVRDWMVIVGILLIVAVLLDGYRRVRRQRRREVRLALNRQFVNAGDDEENHSSELPAGGGRVVSRDHSNQQDDDEERADQHQQQEHQEVEHIVNEPIFPYAEEDDDVVNSTAIERDDEGDDTDVVGKQQSSKKPQEKPNPAEQPEILIVNIIAGDNKAFTGSQLLRLLLTYDLRFGDMAIFHRYEGAGNVIQFSVANGVEPGTFDLDNIDGFSTPALSFFISLPGPTHAMQAFDIMIETAQRLAEELGGNLLDDMRSAMTPQTLEHYRQRIRTYEQRQLAQARD